MSERLGREHADRQYAERRTDRILRMVDRLLHVVQRLDELDEEMIDRLDLALRSTMIELDGGRTPAAIGKRCADRLIATVLTSGEGTPLDAMADEIVRVVAEEVARFSGAAGSGRG